MVIFRLLYGIQALLEYGVQYVLKMIIYIAMFLAVGYKLGWVDRWIWFCIEKEASKIMNGAHVTVGSFDIEWTGVFEGKILAHGSNVVIHTPQKEQWGWEAPLIARVGKASVEANIPITLFNLIFLRKEIPIEAYSIVASDIQCFIERRDSVINVYLLNPGLQLPPPPFRMNGFNEVVVVTGNNTTRNIDDGVDAKLKSTLSTQKIDDHLQVIEKMKNAAPAQTLTTSGQSQADEQAKLLVNEMLTSLQDLGRAAKRGQLPGAIKQQGLELVDRLKGLKEKDAGKLEDGLKVIRQFGKVAVESLQSAPKRILPQPNPSKKGKVVLARVGRIVITDMRIFTKDSWLKPSASATKLDGSQHDSDMTKAAIQDTTARESASTTGVDNSNVNSSLKNSNSNSQIENDGGWNKPILIERMVIRASELCPSMSMKDSQELPAIYQSIDRVIEVVLRRLVAEMAKSNTGKLLSVSMGEVLSVMMSNPQPSVSTQSYES